MESCSETPPALSLQEDSDGVSKRHGSGPKPNPLGLSLFAFSPFEG